MVQWSNALMFKCCNGTMVKCCNGKWVNGLIFNAVLVKCVNVEMI
jgi:hypothetical protein